VPIELFGFQEGQDGFVLYGLEPEPIDYCFLRANCGRGAGKTMASAVRAMLYMCKYPGSRGMIIGLTADKVRDTILPTMYQVAREMGMRDGTHFEYNKTERRWSMLFNGSLAFMRSAEEPQMLPGPTLAWFWLDEYRKMPEIVWNLMLPTLRQNAPDGQPPYPRQAWMSSTPAGRSHWSRKVWFPKAYSAEFDEPLYQRLAGTYRSYRANTKDNPHNPPEFYQTLASTYGIGTALYQQEVEGKEITMEDLVYSNFDRTYHCVPRSQWPTVPDKVIAGVDFGFDSPSSIVVEGFDGERRYLMDVFYKRHMDEDALVNVAKVLKKKHGIRYFLCDSSDPRWIRKFQQKRLRAYPAKRIVGSTSDPSSGIGLCYAALNKKLSDGRQAFFVDPKTCKPWLREIENYVREDQPSKRDRSEQPRKLNDHAMDAWKYAEQGIDKFWAHGDLTKSRSSSWKAVA